MCWRKGCGKCVVIIKEGDVSEPERIEFEKLGERIKSGYRLACCTRVYGDIRVFVPEESRDKGPKDADIWLRKACKAGACLQKILHRAR